MKKVYILSGAGISQESGIPVFRGEEGLWQNYDIQKVCSLKGWEEDRDYVKRFYDERRVELKNYKPNRAHKIFAKLESEFPNQIYHLTQNVDDLLERAGCKKIIHLHGTLTHLRCQKCQNIFYIGYRSQKSDEKCPKCDSKDVRHNVVMFGEVAPNYRYLYTLSKECDLFVAIGTSGKVIDIVDLSKEFKKTVLINPNREEYVTIFGSHNRFIDTYFDIFIQKNAVEAADELYELIKEYLLN